MGDQMLALKTIERRADERGVLLQCKVARLWCRRCLLLPCSVPHIHALQTGQASELTCPALS